MRIALANSTRIWGGAEVMTVRLARGLRARGHEVVILCRRGSPLVGRLAGEMSCEATLGGFDANPVAVARTLRALRRHRSDVMMTMTQKDPRTAGVAARIAGVPVVVRQAVDVPFLPRAHHRLFYGWLPAHLVAPSATARETMLASAPWLGPGDVTAIVNGIDVAAIAAAAPAALGLPAGAVAVGYVSRLEEPKGVLDLVAAWPSIAGSAPDAHLVMVRSGGRLQDRLADATAGMPRVHWIPFREEIGPLMQALDILVAPSHSEGFGLVVAEAMAAGTPVAAARASNLARMVRDGVDGRHFEVKAPESLARVVAEMVRDPGARRAMGEAGRLRAVSEFSTARMLEEYETLLGRFARA